MEQDVGSDEPVDAAVVFEALRREVALLNVAVAGLAAERRPAPDYSETLGEIAKGVSVTVRRLAKVLTSPAVVLGPGEIARQIATVAQDTRRQEQVSLQQALETLQQAAGSLNGLINATRLAASHQRKLLQAGLAGLVSGGVLFATLPAVVIDNAPARWAWPERWAARILHRDRWSAGEQLLASVDPTRWKALTDREMCAAAAAKPSGTGSGTRGRDATGRRARLSAR